MSKFDDIRNSVKNITIYEGVLLGSLGVLVSIIVVTQFILPHRGIVVTIH